MNVKGIIIFLNFCVFVKSQVYNISVIDEQLQNNHDNLIAKEGKIEGQINDLIPFFNQTLSLLKIFNKTMSQDDYETITDLYYALDNLLNVLNDLSTLDNYLPYNNIQNCSDANRKMSEIEFDMRKYSQLLIKSNLNFTSLSMQHSWVSYRYILAQSIIPVYFNKIEKQKMIPMIIRTVEGIMSEYSVYTFQINDIMKKEKSIGNDLRNFIQQNCFCGANVNSDIKTNLSMIESIIQNIENSLINCQNSMLNVTNNILDNIDTANDQEIGYTPSAPALYNQIYRIEYFVNDFLGISNYLNNTWNIIQNCNDFFIRIGLIWFKYWNYHQILMDCNKNIRYIHSYQVDLNTTSANVKLDKKQKKVMNNFIGNMIKWESMMGNYSSQLNYSVVNTLKILMDIKVVSDTFCECSDINSAITTDASVTEDSSASGLYKFITEDFRAFNKTV
ncbi:hypothetical protein PVAND_016155 [Polypedilum vanderplanki]|uniref:Uncharacterized protein n=1 Tax=Polypedilum vanderplanki TaxID=319348 RepID=A0A9J6BFC8_POLVA|nr:hypothetical protein PVAND_016155 [Polypedilum vanderplanki]